MSFPIYNILLLANPTVTLLRDTVLLSNICGFFKHKLEGRVGERKVEEGEHQNQEPAPKRPWTTKELIKCG